MARFNLADYETVAERTDHLHLLHAPKPHQLLSR